MNDFAMQRGLEIRRKKRIGEESVTLAATLSGGLGGCCKSKPLGGAATASGELTNVVEEDGALEVVELRGVHGDLGEEGIGHEDRGLVAMARIGVSQEGGDVDLKGPGEAIERRQGRDGLAIFDLGDIGAGNAHAGGELSLREIAHVAQVANG